MENSKRGKVIQMLSPENYIRQKARNLPVYECLVNANWEESQLANLVIARQHTNGNITAGLFLVDLLCLGVKDSAWFFNISIPKYHENIEEYMEIEEGIEKIDYVLAHNIVQAGLEFADDYEFKPHKDFTSVTQYILDEDTDDIPIIEIECGIDGLPAFMPGPLDSDPKAKQVIAHLERVAGHGNYYLIDEDGMVMNDVDDGSDEEEYPFADLSLEEKRNEFAGYFERIDQLSTDEAKSFFVLAQSIIDDLIDQDKYDEYFDTFDSELSEITVENETIPDEMLGIETGGASLPLKVKEQFLEFLDLSADLKKLKKQLATFRKNHGVEAATAYLELIVAEMEESEAYDGLLKTAAEKYPRYALVQMLWVETKIDEAISGAEENSSFQYNYFFPGRDFIHSREFFSYLHLRTLVISREGSIEKLEAWKEVLFDYQTDGMSVALLNSLATMFQIGLVVDRLKIK
jgi:hypothetical protein